MIFVAFASGKMGTLERVWHERMVINMQKATHDFVLASLKKIAAFLHVKGSDDFDTQATQSKGFYCPECGEEDGEILWEEYDRREYPSGELYIYYGCVVKCKECGTIWEYSDTC